MAYFALRDNLIRMSTIRYAIINAGSTRSSWRDDDHSRYDAVIKYANENDASFVAYASTKFSAITPRQNMMKMTSSVPLSQSSIPAPPRPDCAEQSYRVTNDGVACEGECGTPRPEMSSSARNDDGVRLDAYVAGAILLLSAKTIRADVGMPRHPYL